tara:strand:+ start:84 stop:233 length:150 start_codon:yes stop_codon:yes gene_type:complete
MINLYFFSVWLLLVILWNFGFPNAEPIWDVIAAVFLSLLSNSALRLIKK